MIPDKNLEMIHAAKQYHDDKKKIKSVREQVRELSNDFPLYQEIFTS